ncbi:MAG: riboflavin synthase, partial [Acidobacteria bacterium]
RIVIEARTVTESARDGDSIAVNGVCLTALAVQPDSFAADVSKETLFRSTLGSLRTGSPVNLEASVTPVTRLGGHIVQGHVDARGKFLSAESHGESWTFRIAYPKEIAQYLVFKGSVAVEGISLTIAELTDDYFEIAVIPKTWEVTNFSHLKPGDEVNLEVDVIAKYVERILTTPELKSESPPPLMIRNDQRLPAVCFLGIILALIGVNWFLFGLFHRKYFLWYLNNGPIISLAAGFLAPTWTSMKARVGLISSNPAAYIAACMQVLGIFFSSLAPSKSSQKVQPKNIGIDIGLDGGVVKVFDDILYLLIVLVMAILALAWVVFVAPLAYFVMLVAGVPARQALRGKVVTTYIDEEEGQVTITKPQAGAKLPTRISDLSFARDPFAVTQAVSSLVLWVAGTLYSRIG